MTNRKEAELMQRMIGRLLISLAALATAVIPISSCRKDHKFATSDS